MDPKFLYGYYNGKLVRAGIKNGISDWLDFGEMVPAGAEFQTAFSDDPDLTVEQFLRLPTNRQKMN